MAVQSANQLEQANNAFLHGDFTAALKMYDILAANGSKGALLGLAAIYERGGGGVAQDLEKARYWYGIAYAKGKSAKAALALGHIYSLGLGVKIDYEKSFYYYSKLENGRDPIGFLRLGILYESGKGVAQDLQKAREYYRRASKLGSIRARKNWSVLELKRGNLPVGLFLWLWVIAQGVPLALINVKDRRLRFL